MRARFATIGLPLLLSCSGGSDQNTPGDQASIPLEQMDGVLRKALCQKVYSCCSPPERAENPAIGTDAKSCQTTLPGYATFLLGELAVSVRQGRAIYHGDKLARCLAQLETQSCQQLKMPVGGLDVGAFCEGVIEPKVPLGGACLDYWDCVGGWCAGDAGDLQDRCAPLQPDGGECDEEKECAGGSCTDEQTCAQHEPEAGNLCSLGAELPD